MQENYRVLIRTPVIEDPRYNFIMQEHLIFKYVLFLCILLKWLACPFFPFIKHLFEILHQHVTHVADSQKACNVYGMVLQFINFFISALVYS